MSDSRRNMERTDYNCGLFKTSQRKIASSCRDPSATWRGLPIGLRERSERSAAVCYERCKITGAEGPTFVVSKQTGRKQRHIVAMRQQWRAGRENSSGDSQKESERYNNAEEIREHGQCRQRAAALRRTGVLIKSSTV